MRVAIQMLAALAAVPFAAAVAQAPAAPSAAMAPEDVVQARQAAFGLSAQVFVALRAAMAAPQGDIQTLAGPARQLQRWAHTIPAMFPDGSNVAPTHALPTVWSDRAGFAERAEAYRSAAAALAAAAQANDRAAAQAQLQAVGAACQACHERFRSAD